jgi:hypothetical protein
VRVVGFPLLSLAQTSETQKRLLRNTQNPGYEESWTKSLGQSPPLPTFKLQPQSTQSQEVFNIFLHFLSKEKC